MARLPETMKLYITLLALVSGHVIIANECCVPPALQTNCSDTFGVDGNEESCYIYHYPSSTRHACPLVSSPTSDSPHPSTFTSSVAIIDTEVIYSVRCETAEECTPDEHKMANCHKSSGGWTHIALVISYEIHGSGFQGVMFNLTTDFAQEFESLDKSCHYVCLDNQMSPSKFENKIFTYSGYVGLHPGATYNLTATALYSTNPSTSMETVHIKNCKYRLLRNKKGVCDYFCNLRTPANNSRERMMGVGQDLYAWFEVHEWEEDKITSYNFSLKKDGTDRWIETELIEKKKESIKWDNERGIWRIDHKFSGTGPGKYTVQVFGQPDTVCLNDIHWQQNCSASRTSVTVEPVHTTKDNTAIDHSTSSVAGPVAGKSSKIEDVSIQVMLLIIIIGSVVVLSSVIMIQLMKRIRCSGIQDLDTQTVATDWIGNQYQPVPLKTPPLPGELCPYTLDDVIFDGTTTPTTCSETTSDSMSRVLPVNTKKGRHAKDDKHTV